MRRPFAPGFDLRRNKSVVYGYMKPGLEPTEHPTVQNIAWAAGIYEGEGCCNNHRSQSVVVCQKDRWICDRLRAMFGGSVHNTNSDKGFRWYVSGTRARGFLYTVFTFLSPWRREQIRVVFGGTTR